ncbi:hypothetical protein CC85DRAFT_241501 [Cutaneotrichosporon oleaginosum]|uniref:Golgi apparatus membrane protein TVP38 n=1 Tax=Cutaneotrichosporon oleaginosum TaxID=879819 RepID=A0A0J0XV99_9TREE|nr:uncharacterized protein CC85DRAFT_241501 [Cutaneotrichosporon oleaginosum]KLT44987.1 hypothetical protein CC85DRAFT_241501 [Cutaneotrichosporon oleaginosum]TXT09675.1 hypothetical protein COLE_03609 [Cutaneotrichosporon oleaginosum]
MSNHRPHYGATGAAPSPASPRTPNTRTFLLPRSPGSNFSTETGLTHAEQEEYERGLLTWERAKNWRFWLRWAWVPWYLLGGVLAAGVCTVALYHRELIMLLMPFARHIQLARYGWLVPIGIMVVLSFPPLFGNEVVIILCGVVWGVRAGFLIVAAGTVVGEMACFTVYGTCCRRRARRMAHMSLNYACLTRVISSGGLFIAWVVRLSAIPTHVSTVRQAPSALTAAPLRRVRPSGTRGNSPADGSTRSSSSRSSSPSRSR